MTGYGQVSYLRYPSSLRKAGEFVHHQLALRGLIVIDPEPESPGDLERSVMAALELAKVRRADRLDVVHMPDGGLDPIAEDLVQRAGDLGKPICHHYLD